MRPADALTSVLGKTAAEATHARYAPQFGSLHKQHVDHILIALKSYRGSNQRPRPSCRAHRRRIWRRRNMATEGTLHRHLHEQTTSEIWTRTSKPIRSCWRVAELPPDILHDSLACCSILVPISGWTFFFGLYLLALWLLSRGFVCIGVDNLFSCALGAPWSALGAPGRHVFSLSLSLYAPRCARLTQIFCSPSVSRHIARWRVACAGVAPQSASEP